PPPGPIVVDTLIGSAKEGETAKFRIRHTSKFGSEEIKDTFEIYYDIYFITASAEDLRSVSGTITLGPAGSHAVDVYHFRDLINEPTESYAVSVKYRFQGADKYAGAAGKIENLERPKFALSSNSLREGETKEFWVDLEYPIDIESTVSITSKDNTARVAWGDYEAFSATSFPFDPGNKRSRYSFNVSALSDVAIEGNENLFAVIEHKDVPYESVEKTVTTQLPIEIHDVGPINLNVTESIGPVYVLSGDDDFDQVLYSSDLNGGPVRRPGDRQFVPVQLKLSVNTSLIVVRGSKLTFDFNEAYLSETDLSVSGETRGLLRIWTKPWHVARTENDLVHSGVAYNQSDFSMSPSGDLTLYVEAATAGGFVDEHLSTIDVHWDVAFQTLGDSFAAYVVQNTRNTRPVKVATRVLPPDIARELARMGVNEAYDLLALYEQIYNPAQVVNTSYRDPLLDFLALKHNLTIIFTEIRWPWQSRIVRPNSDDPEDRTWGVVIDKSDLQSKGLVWGVEELRTLMLASIGVGYISP
ncbi:MAG: hypothetical protein ACK5N9_10475, partial [Pirellula sp.]